MDRKAKLIHYLNEKKDYVTAKQISRDLQISSRTICNYVAEINKTHGINMIISCNKGYKISYMANFPEEKNDSIDNFQQRSNYLFKLFLLDHIKSIDIFDFCDEIFTSISTVKSDISKLNKLYAGKIKFYIKNNHIYLSGNEINKKLILSSIIKAEAPNGYLSLDLLKKTFPTYNVDYINRTIQDSLTKNNYYLNQLNSLNLLLHILIMIDNHGTIKTHCPNEYICNKEEKQISSQIIDDLEKITTISFSHEEKNELAALLLSTANFQFEGKDNIIDKRYVEMALNCITQLYDIYAIDLNTSTFLLPFAFHLRNLESRCKYGISIHNPMMNTIKKNYPLIYDLSIYLSHYLKKKYDLNLNDDEISFITLHIGGEIDRQNHNEESKLRSVIIAPDYLNMRTKAFNKVMINFEKEINLIQIVETPEKLTNSQIDLIISLYDLRISNIPIVKVSPKIDNKDLILIYNTIEDIKEDRKKKILKENFDIYFHDNLFYSEKTQKNKNEIISFICEDMYRKNYVQKSFYNSVIERENSGSTAFDYIAIPHAAKMTSEQSSIAVYINSDGILWDDKVVKIVFMISVSLHETKSFIKLYEAVISLFDNNDIIERVLHIHSFSEFKKIILNSI